MSDVAHRLRTMRKTIVSLCAAALLGCMLLGGCEPAPSSSAAEDAESTAEDVAQIEQMSAARAEAFNNSNAEGIAVHFTEDAVLMVPGRPATTGRAAVTAYYQSVFDAYEPTLDSRYEEVDVSGDLAYGRGIAEVTLVPKEGGPPVVSTSKYINILERQPDGTWKTTHDIWNANEAPDE